MLFIENLDLKLIKINDPKIIENNSNDYFFEITYDNNEFIFKCNNSYKLDKKNNGLVIFNKNEVSIFSNLYNHILNLFYEQHDTWFDSEMEFNLIKELFNNYLIPNIEENCLNLNIDIKNIDISNENILLIPKIKISGLKFMNENIYINLELIDYDLVNEINISNEDNVEKQENIQNEDDVSKENNVINEDDLVNKNDVVKEEGLEENLKEPVEENVVKEEDVVKQEDEENEEDVVKQEYEENEEEEEEEEEDEEDEEDEDEEDGENLNEVKINDDDLEMIDFNLSDEDYFIIYRILNDNIKQNLSKSVIDILKERSININKEEINELLEESEDESDNSEYSDQYSENSF